MNRLCKLIFGQILSLLLVVETVCAKDQVSFPITLGPMGLRIDHIQIAEDPEFRRIILERKTRVSEQQILSFEESGTYYVRFMRAGNEQGRMHLAVLLKRKAQGDLVKISWIPKKEQTNYRLHFQKPDGQKISGLTNQKQIYLKDYAGPLIVGREQFGRFAVEGRGRPLDSFTMQTIPASELIWMQATDPLAKPKRISPADLGIDPFAPDTDQEVYEPQWAEREGEEGAESDRSDDTEPATVRLPPLVRSNRISAYLRSFREQFTIERLDRYVSEIGPGAGVGLQGYVYIQPTLQLYASLDTHGTQTEYELGGTDTPKSVQRRVRFVFGPRIDVLNLEQRREEMSFDVGPLLGFLQLPLRHDDQKVGDFGVGGVWRQYNWKTSLSLAIYQSQSYEAACDWTLPWRFSNFEPDLGYYIRSTKARDAPYVSTFMEQGVRLGLGVDF